MIEKYPDKALLKDELYKYLLQASDEAIDSHGRFLVALSGGSALKLLSESLTGKRRKENINWQAWHLFWADERCVNLESSQSNYAATKKMLLDAVNIPSSQIHPVNTTLSPEKAAEDYEKKILAILDISQNALPQFDLIVLGFGEDGHTASLFPHHKLLREQKRIAASLEDSPKPPPARITLTLPVINNARNIAIVAAGGYKYKIAVSSDTSLPIKMINPVCGNIKWFLTDKSS